MNNNAEVARKNPGVAGEVQDALTDGFCESEESCKEVWLDLKRRGLTVDPRLAIGDGALGFWKALRSTEGKFHRSHILFKRWGCMLTPVSWAGLS